MWAENLTPEDRRREAYESWKRSHARVMADPILAARYEKLSGAGVGAEGAGGRAGVTSLATPASLFSRIGARACSLAACFAGRGARICA